MPIRDEPLENPVGTHGLHRSDDQQELGKVVISADRETWIWRTDSSGAVFEYADGTFNGSKASRTIPDPSESRVHETRRSGTLLGDHSLGRARATGATRSWYVRSINASNRMDVAPSDALSFTKRTERTPSFGCYTEPSPRKPLLS